MDLPMSFGDLCTAWIGGHCRTSQPAIKKRMSHLIQTISNDPFQVRSFCWASWDQINEEL